MKVMVPDYLVESLLPQIAEADPSVQLLGISADGRFDGSLEELEVFFKFYPDARFPKVFGAEVLRAILAGAPRLRWIHSGKAGVEDLLIPELVDSDIVLTNGAGAPKRAIAEMVLAYILADAKAIQSHWDFQKARAWKHLPHRELPGLTVAILGLGKIGMEIARLCKALDLRVIGTRRTVPEDAVPGVDAVFPSVRQEECVAAADFVVVAAALTPESNGMVGASTFRAMKKDAILINVARGPIVDEKALLDALHAGEIRGACLDVFAEEPLPSDHPFYTLSGVVVTPHNSPNSQNVMAHMVGVFGQNFQRYCGGEPLLNVVDKRAGY